ncbi:hypothetical protein BACSP_04434 [Bacillus sp. T2.9-1]|nr:hypothetical protein BACSP_04434 [Bacillus sp. T2.9-1]
MAPSFIGITDLRVSNVRNDTLFYKNYLFDVRIMERTLEKGTN